MFIVVRGNTTHTTVHTVERYLYHGQSIAQGPVTGMYGTFMIVDTGTDDQRISEYLLGRLQSGPYGAILFHTMLEADTYIENEKD
jgi:hypothetical protein